MLYLHDPVRQQDEHFIDILNKVRNYELDESMVLFLNERSFHESQVPVSCLRHYTTRQRVARANEKDYAEFPGEVQRFQAYGAYVGNKQIAKIALRETRLLECLFIKPDMPVMLIHSLHALDGYVNGIIALIEYMEEENICLKEWLPNRNDAIYWIQRISRKFLAIVIQVRNSQSLLLSPLRFIKHKAQQSTMWESIWMASFTLICYVLESWRTFIFWY
ncbi:hypothetical protein G6F43_010515 [Rhizopus delemar]|nr:hypothetical protein G6F43_010515 [Rhizopus delemar]